jgi:hypothetical protein
VCKANAKSSSLFLKGGLGIKTYKCRQPAPPPNFTSLLPFSPLIHLQVDTILALANFPLQIHTVADQVTALVKEALEGVPGAAQLVKKEDEVWNFVSQNCKLFYKTNPTVWTLERYGECGRVEV